MPQFKRVLRLKGPTFGSAVFWTVLWRELCGLVDWLLPLWTARFLWGICVFSAHSRCPHKCLGCHGICTQFPCGGFFLTQGLRKVSRKEPGQRKTWVADCCLGGTSMPGGRFLSHSGAPFWPGCMYCVGIAATGSGAEVPRVTEPALQLLVSE